MAPGSPSHVCTTDRGTRCVNPSLSVEGRDPALHASKCWRQQQLVPTTSSDLRAYSACAEPYTTERGGPLVVRRETFVKGRGNVLIEYPCSKKDAPYVSFVGCHLDVVPANPDDWDFR